MALNYKKLHDPVSKKELNGINSISRAVTEYKTSITLNTVSEYGLFTVTDDTLFVSGGMPTATYTINNELSMVIDEDGDGELPLTERLDSTIDLKVTFPPYYTYTAYDLVLSSATPIIQNGDNASVNCLLTHDNVEVSGESLGYVVKHGTTTIDTGSVVTGSDGTATIPYTGTGIGDVSVEVSYGTLLQKTYEIIDGLFYDAGTIAPPENTWIMNLFSASYSTDGTTLSSSSFATAFANLRNTGVNPFDWNSPVCIEFDITNVNSKNADFQIYDNTNNCIRSFRALGITGNDHVKILVESDKIRYFVNDIEQTNLAFDIAISTFRCGFRGTGTLTFKNFVIYPSGLVYDLVLSCNTPIIQTGDSAIVTASLTRDGGAYSDETLTYTVKHGTTTIDTGSVVTGSDGTATISYTGTGIGDVTFEVSYRTLLQKTYELEDLQVYDPMTSNSRKWILPSTVTYGYNEYNENGWKIGNASTYTYIQLDETLTFPFEVSFKLTEHNGNFPNINWNGKWFEFYSNRISFGGGAVNHSLQLNKEYHCRFYSNKMEVWCEDTKIVETSTSIANVNPLSMGIGANRYARMKEFKIKAL